MPSPRLSYGEASRHEMVSAMEVPMGKSIGWKKGWKCCGNYELDSASYDKTPRNKHSCLHPREM